MLMRNTLMPNIPAMVHFLNALLNANTLRMKYTLNNWFFIYIITRCIMVFAVIRMNIPGVVTILALQQLKQN